MHDAYALALTLNGAKGVLAALGVALCICRVRSGSPYRAAFGWAGASAGAVALAAALRIVRALGGDLSMHQSVTDALSFGFAPLFGLASAWGWRRGTMPTASRLSALLDASSFGLRGCPAGNSPRRDYLT
jgi:hypothetical protein